MWFSNASDRPKSQILRSCVLWLSAAEEPHYIKYTAMITLQDSHTHNVKFTGQGRHHTETSQVHERMVTQCETVRILHSILHEENKAQRLHRTRFKNAHHRVKSHTTVVRAFFHAPGVAGEGGRGPTPSAGPRRQRAVPPRCCVEPDHDGSCCAHVAPPSQRRCSDTCTGKRFRHEDGSRGLWQADTSTQCRQADTSTQRRPGYPQTRDTVQARKNKYAIQARRHEHTVQARRHE
jgi:hypothetical protein